MTNQFRYRRLRPDERKKDPISGNVYKYSLEATWEHKCIADYPDCGTQWWGYRSGRLIVQKDYWWDGPSGPTFDTPETIEPALPHDVAYQAIRLDEMPMKYRKPADLEFLELLKRAGVGVVRRTIWYVGVRVGGGIALRRSRRKLRKQRRGR